MHSRDEFIETLIRNHEIAEKFFEIQTSILSILNFRDFLEKLLTEIHDKRDIPYVWISLIDNSDVADMIQKSAPSEVLAERTNRIDKETFLRLIRNNVTPILANSDLIRYSSLIPLRYRKYVRSLAIVPLTLDGEIIGSLNHADTSALRYQPDMDTTLLKRLAIIVSICLSNVMAHERLNFLASRDSLTGLLNRRTLENILNRELDRALRYRTPLTVAFIDVDGFKMVNDRYGHKAGDDILIYVGQTLSKMTRSSDIVGRFAGDEFIVILPNTPLHESHELANRLKSYFVKNPFDYEGTLIQVSISFGLSCIEYDADNDVTSLLRRADAMLYEAKKKKN